MCNFICNTGDGASSDDGGGSDDDDDAGSTLSAASLDPGAQAWVRECFAPSISAVSVMQTRLAVCLWL